MDISKTNKTYSSYTSKYSRGECQICCTYGVIIPCKICEKEACNMCIRRYIMENNVPKCMYCSCIYTRGTLIEMLGKTFINNEYMKHFNSMVVKYHTQNLQSFQKNVNEQIERTRLQQELKSLTLQMKKIKDKMRDVKNKISTIGTSCIEKETTNKSCSDIHCNGFLDSNSICGSCSKETCSICLEPKLSEHVCDKNMKNTIKLLNKETKSCPKCSFAITKIDGCDQMFCTLCNTAFSWKTGIIENNRIHNPHYYEYLRNMSPNGEIRREEEGYEGYCGVDIILARNIEIQNILRKLNVILIQRNENESVSGSVSEKINENNIIYSINFLQLYTINIMYYIENINSWKLSDSSVITNANDKIEKASIDFIMNNIDKKKYEKTIILYNHKKIMANEILLLNTMLYNVIIETFIEFYENTEIETMLFELDKIFQNDDIETTILDLDEEEFEKQSIEYITTNMQFNRKTSALESVEKLKNSIESIIRYYNEEISNIQTIYNNRDETYTKFIVDKNNYFLKTLLSKIAK